MSDDATEGGKLTADLPEEITGKCPMDVCDTEFVSADLETVGDHFSGHVQSDEHSPERVQSDEPPSEIWGAVAVRLMRFRGLQSEVSDDEH